MAFPDRDDLATAAATKHVMSIAQVYVPELVTGYTPACCSGQSLSPNCFPKLC
jgi:hypothetical protein